MRSKPCLSQPQIKIISSPTGSPSIPPAQEWSLEQITAEVVSSVQRPWEHDRQNGGGNYGDTLIWGSESRTWCSCLGLGKYWDGRSARDM